MSELKKCLNEKDFNSSVPELLEIIAQGRRLVQEYNQVPATNSDLKQRILKNLLGELGHNVHIDTPFYCDYGRHIFIGNHVIIGMNCTFVDNNHIRIGDYTMIAPDVKLYTATHPLAAAERIRSDWDDRNSGNFYHTSAHPIAIGKKAWIGGGVTILPGVTIGDECVIGAGSVVNKDIPPGSLAAGNPCKVIRKL
ncbi:sugar O-acetyltransferase [Membranicola marinus]|uniref:Nodulation protein L n=1 Tax=Membranihabitans marinus TaxID=1227546 RepID=A0A953L8N9_9BACT|nr:sugar O-acetyltransferase [Membranihabitans marinus]MBY5957915.1 sugar O-acetyltransferase [Membranihabitans marinus]